MRYISVNWVTEILLAVFKFFSVFSSNNIPTDIPSENIDECGNERPRRRAAENGQSKRRQDMSPDSKRLMISRKRIKTTQ